jgi:hypothetical protein
MEYIIEPGNLLTYKTESKNNSGEDIFEISHKIDGSLKPAVVHGKIGYEFTITVAGLGYSLS